MTFSRVLAALLVVLPGSALLLPSAAASAHAPTPRCGGQVATIVGTQGRDVLRGTPKADVIVGLAGNDRVDGGGGDDLVCGGDGRDRIDGGDGDDRLRGERDGFKMDRGGGSWYGDILEGGPGDDRLLPGYDRRGKGSYSLDEVSFAHAATPVVVDLSTSSRWGTATGEGVDRIRLVVNLLVTGSAHDDTISGTPGPDSLSGGPGNDRIAGLAGADTLDGGSAYKHPARDDDVIDGGAGADYIYAYAGRDVIHGDTGKDQLATYSALPAQLYGDEGDDDILASAVAESGYLVDGGSGHDVVELSSPVSDGYATKCCPQGGTAGFDETTGSWQASFLAGRVADEAVTSSGTALDIEDVTLGHEFAWTYSGTEGPDVVVGGFYFPLRATMLGGDDVVTGTVVADVIDGGDGYDEAYGVDAKDTLVSLEKTHGFE